MKSFSRSQYLGCTNRSFSLSRSRPYTSIARTHMYHHTKGIDRGIKNWTFNFFFRLIHSIGLWLPHFFFLLFPVYILLFDVDFCVLLLFNVHFLLLVVCSFFVWFRVLLQLLHLNDWFITIVLNWNRINVFEVENWTMTISF